MVRLIYVNSFQDRASRDVVTALMKTWGGVSGISVQEANSLFVRILIVARNLNVVSENYSINPDVTIEDQDEVIKSLGRRIKDTAKAAAVRARLRKESVNSLSPKTDVLFGVDGEQFHSNLQRRKEKRNNAAK